MAQPYRLVDYGITNALQNVFPSPIMAKRAPTTADTGYQLGQVWCFPAAPNAIYMLASIVNNVANWQLLEAGGGSGSFATLVVSGLSTLGATTMTGAVSINNSGAATTSIGTAGTGAVLIGNATGGTTFSGNTTSSGTMQAEEFYASGDAGGIAATNGFTGVSVPVAGGTGAFTITSATTAGAAVNAGFLKFYVGVIPVFVPYYTTTA